MFNYRKSWELRNNSCFLLISAWMSGPNRWDEPLNIFRVWLTPKKIGRKKDAWKKPVKISFLFMFKDLPVYLYEFLRCKIVYNCFSYLLTSFTIWTGEWESTPRFQALWRLFSILHVYSAIHYNRVVNCHTYWVPTIQPYPPTLNDLKRWL